VALVDLVCMLRVVVPYATTIIDDGRAFCTVLRDFERVSTSSSCWLRSLVTDVKPKSDIYKMLTIDISEPWVIGRLVTSDTFVIYNSSLTGSRLADMANIVTPQHPG
jgi:hypothetical protein